MISNVVPQRYFCEDLLADRAGVFGDAAFPGTRIVFVVPNDPDVESFVKNEFRSGIRGENTALAFPYVIDACRFHQLQFVVVDPTVVISGVLRHVLRKSKKRTAFRTPVKNGSITFERSATQSVVIFPWPTCGKVQGAFRADASCAPTGSGVSHRNGGSLAC